MLMDSFEVENFRSLKHLKLEKLARVNLLVGKNNSGKTSVLEALFALLGLGSTHGLQVIEEERGLGNEKSDFEYLFNRFNTANTITISITHRVDDADNTTPAAPLSISIAASESDGLTERENVFSTYKKPIANNLRLTANLSDNAEPLVFDIRRDALLNRITISPTPSELAKTLGKKFYFPAAARHSVSELLTTKIDRQILTQKIEALKVNKAGKSLLRVMQNIDGRIESIELGAGGQVYFDLGIHFPKLLPINLMGEGIQRLLDVVSAVANVSGGIVLIDEIDNGLHYSALRILWKGILQAAREYDVQVFATTHSVEALRHLTWVLDEEENASYRNDVAAYTLIRADDDTVRSYRYGAEQLEYALEHDIEVRN